MISVIIRSKNEERWIRECLRRVRMQTVKDVEVILVDNASEDQTVSRAQSEWPDLKLVQVANYLPGLAINEGVRHSKGEFIAILSAHCLPVDEHWLEKLLASCEDGVAGVYGRQIPTSYSSAYDKRDLLVTFGLDKRVQRKDIFFHNANSLIRRRVWDKIPFDEKVGNIEDRVWGKQVIDAGYVLVYEPEAAVYHYHGIYQNNDLVRVEGAVRVMESLEEQAQTDELVDPQSFEIAAIIPVRSKANGLDGDQSLLLKSVQSAKASKYIDRIILATDDPGLVEMAPKLGVEAPFIRPMELSKDGVRSDEVLQFALGELEKQGYSPDLVVPLEITYPFRPDGLLDALIERLVRLGLDTAVAGMAENRPYWSRQSDELVLSQTYASSRLQREPLHVGLLSLGCVTYAEFIRKGTRLGARIGIYELDDPFAAIEIRDENQLELFAALSNIAGEWQKKHPL